MGVPKFFRYMSERYPCLNEKLREYQIPEFDNLYLDMNGIIHVCSHPDDNPLASMPEETIFKDIFYYIEVMFRLIQPKKLFMMAVDGVAPRAKLNQQRGRRFRSAKQAEAAYKALKTDLSVSFDERFDSNCITPGTEFMDRLHQQLKYFVAYKISTDKLWQRPKIILSGHDTPGEGEHKIMDYIRYLRTQDDWQPNTRHCLHGLDADLIMLGLCSHEIHFSLLREEVKFVRNRKRPANPEEIQFFLLHLSLMRDYLDLEFQALKKTLPFPYDLEKIIDDWVLMGFLVGNDFIPNLPSLHINENALHELYKVYIEILPTLGGYINEKGILNLERFERYMQKLAEFEFTHFQDIESDLRYLESKMGNKKLRKSIESLEDEEITQNEELMNMINATKSALFRSDSEKAIWDAENSETERIQTEFKKYKSKYYMEKMNFEEVTEEVLRHQAECYVRAIQWNLHYYYHGCASWSWHYPYLYAPFISDIKDFSCLGHLEYELGLPFTPFQQLLGVLPPASRKILPRAFQDLMTSPESPIVHFYPETFKTDMNGKLNDWEAVVILPFIDQDALVSAMEPYYRNLTEDEIRRNKFLPMTYYEYTPEDLGVLNAPRYFPALKSNHAKYTIVSLKEIAVPRNKLIWGLLPGASDSFWYGFPTLKHIPVEGKLEEAKVQVFQQPSRGLNMKLYIKGSEGTSSNSEMGNKKKIEEISRKYLGKEVFVAWPHIIKASVTCIVNMKYKYSMTKQGKIEGSELSEEEMGNWSLHARELRAQHKNHLGIELGQVDELVYAKQLIGSKYELNDRGKLVKKFIWAPNASPYPIQTVLTNINMLHCEKVLGGNDEKIKCLSDVYPAGQQVFLLNEHYGAKAKILHCSNKGDIKIEVKLENEPNVDDVLELNEENDLSYFQGSRAAAMCGLENSHVLSRLTGAVLLQTSEKDPNSKVNIGLNMKFNKTNQELVGYTKRVDGKYWNYSRKAIDLIKEYIEKFPLVAEYVCSKKEDVYMKADIFKDNADSQIQDIIKWLANHPYSKAEKRSFNSELVNEKAIQELEKLVSSDNWKSESTTLMDVKQDALHLPISHITLFEPDVKAVHRLLDRVVNIRECHPVPLGLKGFIIGIEKKDDEHATLYNILFDSPLICGYQLYTEEKRCYSLTRHAFINLSHGRRQHLNAAPSTNQQENSRGCKVKSAKHTLDTCSVQLEGLKISSDSSSKGSAFTPFSTKMEPNLRPDYSGSNNVTKFFSAYRNPNFAAGQLQTSLNQQQSPKRQQPSHGHQPTANSEFQAMWNHLQHQKVPSESMTLPQPNTTPSSKLSAAADEQTNALRKILKLRDTVSTTTPAAVLPLPIPPPPPPPSSSSTSSLPTPSSSVQPPTLVVSNVNTNSLLLQQQQHQTTLRTDQHNLIGRSPGHNKQNCNHALSCCAALINYCQRTGCAYPVYGYANSAKGVYAIICFPDGKQYKGQPAKDKATAAENAACLTLKNLTEAKPPITSQLFQGRPLMKFGSTTLGHQQTHQQTVVRLTNQMTNLPSPPHQWCQQQQQQQQNKRDNWRFQEHLSEHVAQQQQQQPLQQHRPSPSFTAKNFVPLQAQLPRTIQQQQQQPNNNKAMTPRLDIFKTAVGGGQSLSQELLDNSKASSTMGNGSAVTTSSSVDKSNSVIPNSNEFIKQDNSKVVVVTPAVIMLGGDNNKVIRVKETTSTCSAGLDEGSGGVVGGIVTTTTSTCTTMMTIPSVGGGSGGGTTAAAASHHRKPLQPRTKSRLAARFSVPPITKE